MLHFYLFTLYLSLSFQNTVILDKSNLGSISNSETDLNINLWYFLLFKYY